MDESEREAPPGGVTAGAERDDAGATGGRSLPGCRRDDGRGPPDAVTRVGVVTNVRSRRNRRGLAAVRAVLARHPGVLHAELDRAGDLDGALREFARREVDLLVVNGGDGTVQSTLTALFNGAAPFERPPLLAVVPAGGANLIARDVGPAGKPQDALARLLDLAPGFGDGAAAERVARSVLSVAHGGPDRPPVYGMFFGAGAFYSGTAFARERLYPRGVGEPLAAALAIGWCVARGLLPRSGAAKAADPLVRGEPMAIAVDGDAAAEAPARRYLLLLATTLRRLLFGLTPFWGGGDGPIRYTTIAAPPRRLARALLPVLRGRPRPWMAGSGYASGAACRLAVATDGPLVLDGEILAPAPGGAPVVVDGGRRVDFLRC